MKKDLLLMTQDQALAPVTKKAFLFYLIFAIYLTTIIFIVEGIIPRPNKNPNVCSGRSKHRDYRYRIVKRRRRLLKEGYRFDRRTREWVKR